MSETFENPQKSKILGIWILGVVIIYVGKINNFLFLMKQQNLPWNS